MKQSLKEQKGLTFISLVFVLGAIAFFVLLVLKIAPVYMNHSNVLNALSAVENMVDVETKSKHEIRQSFSKRFNMNYVDHVTLEDVTIIKHSHYVRVEIEYERVVPLIGNLSALMEFYESFEVGEDE